LALGWLALGWLALGLLALGLLPLRGCRIKFFALDAIRRAPPIKAFSRAGASPEGCAAADSGSRAASPVVSTVGVCGEGAAVACLITAEDGWEDAGVLLTRNGWAGSDCEVSDAGGDGDAAGEGAAGSAGHFSSPGSAPRRAGVHFAVSVTGRDFRLIMERPRDVAGAASDRPADFQFRELPTDLALSWVDATVLRRRFAGRLPVADIGLAERLPWARWVRRCAVFAFEPLVFFLARLDSRSCLGASERAERLDPASPNGSC